MFALELLHEPGLVLLKAFTSVFEFVSVSLSLFEVVPETLKFFPEVSVSQLQLQLQLLAILAQLRNLFLPLANLQIELLLHSLALFLKLGF